MRSVKKVFKAWKNLMAKPQPLRKQKNNLSYSKNYFWYCLSSASASAPWDAFLNAMKDYSSIELEEDEELYLNIHTMKYEIIKK